MLHNLNSPMHVALEGLDYAFTSFKHVLCLCTYFEPDLDVQLGKVQKQLVLLQNHWGMIDFDLDI